MSFGIDRLKVLYNIMHYYDKINIPEKLLNQCAFLMTFNYEYLIYREDETLRLP